MHLCCNTTSGFKAARKRKHVGECCVIECDNDATTALVASLSLERNKGDLDKHLRYVHSVHP